MGDVFERLLDDSALRFAAAMAVIETVADGSLKHSTMTGKPEFLGIGYAGYAGVVYVFQRALKKEKLFRVNNYWNALTSVSDTLVGVAMGESITQTQILGVALIVTGILLV